MRPYSPGGRFITLATGARVKPQPPNRQRLQRGLPGYLILFAPHAFAHERQYIPKGLPSPSVFLHISTHFTATRGILPLPKVL